MRAGGGNVDLSIRLQSTGATAPVQSCLLVKRRDLSALASKPRQHLFDERAAGWLQV